MWFSSFCAFWWLIALSVADILKFDKVRLRSIITKECFQLSPEIAQSQTRRKSTILVPKKPVKFWKDENVNSSNETNVNNLSNSKNLLTSRMPQFSIRQPKLLGRNYWYNYFLNSRQNMAKRPSGFKEFRGWKISSRMKYIYAFKKRMWQLDRLRELFR